ncbi:MAG: hypothetical protein J7K40_05420, partial [candidate division Zixibacteria bacterium]|nr:hypothetical protein [candidate division Zixibacteria bacterium]
VSPQSDKVSPPSVDKVSPQSDKVSPPPAPNGDNKKRIDVKLPASVRPALDALRQDDETDAAVLKRLIETVPTLMGQVNDLTSELEHAQSVNKEIREDFRLEFERHQAKYDDQVHEIGQLRAQVKTLTNQIETKLVPTDGQATLNSFGSIGMKDIADEIRDGCEGDETCIGTIAKLQQTRIAAVSKHLDREHDAEQKRLAREHDAIQRQIELDAKKEAQEKDRALKEALAEKEHINKIELQLAKKGGFKQKFLEDVVFISAGASKRPRRDMAEAKRRAHHAAEEEDDWLTQDLEAEETLDMHDDFDESTI